MPEKAEKQEIPVEGSLGLLALGAQGLRAWRLRKEAFKKERDEKG